MIAKVTSIVKITMIIDAAVSSRLLPVPHFIFPFTSKKFPVRLPREFADNPLIQRRVFTADKPLATRAGEILGYFAGSRELAPASAGENIPDRKSVV